MEMKAFFVAAAAILSSGCATLQPHENWAPNVLQSCPDRIAEAPAGVSPLDRQINIRDRAGQLTDPSWLNCAAVRNAQTRSVYYGERATDIGREEAILSTLSITALIASAGFAAFDAHPDNIRAAALIAAASEGGRRTLNTVSRRDIYGLAFRRTACVQLSAAPLLTTKIDADQTAGKEAVPALWSELEDAKTLLKQLDQLLADGAVMARYDWRPGRAADIDPSIHGLRGDTLRVKLQGLKEKRDALAALIERGAAVHKDGQAGLGAITRAPGVINAEMGAIEEETAKKIATLQVDVSGLLKKLAEDLTANMDGAAAVAKVYTAGDLNRDKTLEQRLEATMASLSTKITAVESLNLKAYADATAAIGTCRTRVVDPPKT